MGVVDARAYALIKQMATNWIASGEELFLENKNPPAAKPGESNQL